MVVYVLNCNKGPLMPCLPRKAKMLLKSGKAKVVSKNPFTIKLLFKTAQRKQVIVAGMDTGAKTIGVAAVSCGKSVYQSEVILRSEEIKGKMDQRRMYRRTRRGRKTGYRKARFLNRRGSIKLNRLPPSLRHIISSHLREKKFVESILPVTSWFVETASFDIHKITNPEVSKMDGKSYQEGRQKDFYNTKAYVMARDGHVCQMCKGKTKDKHLEVHHVVFRSNGGSNSPDNLVTLCSSCHKKLHGMEDGILKTKSKELLESTKKHTAGATKVSIVKTQIKNLFGNFTETFGYITKFNRENMGFSKTHFHDALVIASQCESVRPQISYFYKKLVSKGDYQQTSGARSEKNIPTGKLFGFRKFDFVKSDKGIGFVKGKRSSGYFALVDHFGKKITDSVNIKKNCIRIFARKLYLLTRVEILAEGHSIPPRPEGRGILEF